MIIKQSRITWKAFRKSKTIFWEGAVFSHRSCPYLDRYSPHPRAETIPSPMLTLMQQRNAPRRME